MHGVTPKGIDCPAIDGLIKEAKQVAGDTADKNVLDAAIIASAQAIEHYEMSKYGSRSRGQSNSGAPTARRSCSRR